MITLKVDQEKPEQERILQIATFLKEGKIAAIPTETFYAFAANPFSKEAVERIFAIKERDHKKALIMLIPGSGTVFDLAEDIPEIFSILAKHFWPGPLTLIMKSSSRIPAWVDGGTGKVALRVSPNRIVSEILRNCNFPLTGTSANISGRAPAQSGEEVSKYFKHGLDLIVDGGKVGGGKPSTILDVSLGRPSLVREGQVSRTELEKILHAEIAYEGASESYQ